MGATASVNPIGPIFIGVIMGMIPFLHRIDCFCLGNALHCNDNDLSGVRSRGVRIIGDKMFGRSRAYIFGFLAPGGVNGSWDDRKKDVLKWRGGMATPEMCQLSGWPD